MTGTVKPRYLGDGVYASFDGYHICLAVGNHTNHVVALEPNVLAALRDYEAQVRAAPIAEGPDSWLIIKESSFYRPNAQGYTTNKTEAGRFTEEDAKAHAASCSDLTVIKADDWPRRST